MFEIAGGSGKKKGVGPVERCVASKAKENADAWQQTFLLLQGGRQWGLAALAMYELKQITEH